MESKHRAKDSMFKENTEIIRKMEIIILHLRKQVELLMNQGIDYKDEEFIFTRGDSDYNQRALQKSLHENRVEEKTVKDMDNKMEEYLSIPLKRLVRLARRYLHHRRMKNIENIIQSPVPASTRDVNLILGEMETLQNTRIAKWNSNSKQLSKERVKLANLLLKRMQELEKEKGIFLIKPYMTLKSNKRNEEKQVKENTQHDKNTIHSNYIRRINKTVEPILKTTSILPDEAPANLWKPSHSIDDELPTPKPFNGLSRIPRLLELDVNRAMYQENQISTLLTPSKLPLTNRDVQLNLISYMTVDRPIGVTEICSGDTYDMYRKRPLSLPALNSKVKVETSEEAIFDQYRSTVSSQNPERDRIRIPSEQRSTNTMVE